MILFNSLLLFIINYFYFLFKKDNIDPELLEAPDDSEFFWNIPNIKFNKQIIRKKAKEPTIT